MGLSFHDEPSLTEAVSDLQFAADNPNPIGSIAQDESLDIELDDPDADLEMVNNIRRERRDDSDGGKDDIQMVDR